MGGPLGRSDTLEDVKLSSPDDSPAKVTKEEKLDLPKDIEISLDDNDDDDDDDLFKSARGVVGGEVEPEREKQVLGGPEIAVEEEQEEENPFKVSSIHDTLI